jgi:beta-N-acetylhexosaminidase
LTHPGEIRRQEDHERHPARVMSEVMKVPGVTRLRRLLPIVLAAGLAWSVTPAPAAAGGPTLAQLVGQKLVVAMSGTTADSNLLGRIGRGEVGGVILFGSNITTAKALRALTAQLSHAAEAGGQPPLLIATDQEGGSVKRVSWAPPTRSVPTMGASGSTTTASAEGKSTASILRCAGINADLAPVADVPSSTSSFMYQQGRTWSFDATKTASLSNAFASGLEAGGGLPSMKHFPGIGFATANTDSHVVTISATKTALAPGLKPYQQAIAAGIPLIMLSNATYPAYDATNAAGWSHAIGVSLLRTTLGFTGVTITDSLTGTAAARGTTATTLAVRAAKAGTDMILVTGSEASTRSTYATLLQDAQDGTIPLATLQASYDRIVALKAGLKGPVADAGAPTVGDPQSRLYAPATLGTTTTPVRTSFTASDACAISTTSIRRSTGGATPTTQGLATATSRTITQSLALGSTYRYDARATDGAGNASAWAAGVPIEPVVRQSSSSLVALSGGWGTASYTSYSGGTTRFASAAGASASYTFTGSAIGWVTAVGPTRGSAKVYVDGTYRTTVSLYAAQTGLRRIAYATNWAIQGSHTIRIVVVGTSGHPRVDVDAFVRLYQP